ncbi:MAG TPA: hypothetical protein VGN07_11255 [Steroidobacteraceae bacterium]|jgi:hypothetical protein
MKRPMTIEVATVLLLPGVAAAAVPLSLNGANAPAEYSRQFMIGYGLVHLVVVLLIFFLLYTKARRVLREQASPHDGTASVPGIWRCVWVFATRGPFFGYVTAIALLGVARAGTVLEGLMFPLTAVLVAPVGLPMAWFMGLIPAILIGVAYWALRVKADVRALSATALSTLVAGIVCAGAVAIIDGDFAGLFDVASWSMMVVPGIVATPLCAVSIERGSMRGFCNK